MLGAHARIVQASRNTVGGQDLPVVVLHQVGPVAVQHAGAACRQRRRMATGLHAVTSSLDTDEPHRVVDKWMKDSNGVGPPAHAGDHGIGQRPGLLKHLRPRLSANHRLEVPHHGRIRVWACNCTNDVERVVDMGDPVSQRLVHRVLERPRSRGDGHDFSPQQPHAVDVGRLARNVLLSHVHHTLQAQARRYGRSSHSMLARSCFGNDARLAHAAGQHGLAHGVVHLVGTGVVEVLPFEEDPGAAKFTCQSLRKVQRRRTAHIVGEVGIEFGLKSRV